MGIPTKTTTKKKYIYIYTTQGKSTGLVQRNKNRIPPLQKQKQKNNNIK